MDVRVRCVCSNRVGRPPRIVVALIEQSEVDVFLLLNDDGVKH